MNRLPLFAASIFVIAIASDEAAAQEATFETETGPVQVETVASGLEHPWALAFLPDGRMLVTERPGRMRIIAEDGSLSEPLHGVPEVYSRNQGGLLDLALHPDFASNSLVYFTFSHPEGGNAGTAVARGRLAEDGGGGRLEEVEILFSMNNKDRSGQHFGSRIVFADDGTVLFSIGDRGTMERAQDPQDHAGSILRINEDGSIPDDNPFSGSEQAQDEIFSWGHRNAQAMAIHPESQQVWAIEHGARGGDEVNVIYAGRNYGWPVVTHGIDYSGAQIGEGITEQEGMESPVHYWDPSIAPSGMTFYSGDVFSDWQGDILVGALAGTALHRLTLEGEAVVHDEPMLRELGERIRDVRQGPDGHVYLATDAPDGRILRLSPGPS